ncbi:MAG TPA: pyridoxamine 5'-phosphate oxidase family protein [Bacteroidales bacterium]|nr:pyridoxamine 5'-phosphate oxidase family protein [Bacteroidales bacterium]
MRRGDKEIKDNKVIQEVLEHSAICRLGLVDGDEAYIVPVNYAFKDGLIYIHSAPHGRKIEILKKNNKVSFEIEYAEEIIKNDIPCEWTAKYRSVMGKGIVKIENDPVMKKAGLDLIMRKYGASGELTYNDQSVSRIVLLILEVISVAGKQSGDWQ